MICPKCNESIPDISRFCLYCGESIHLSQPAADEEVDLDWENRILCSDGACIGTIEQGKCTVCGKPPIPECDEKEMQIGDRR